MAGIYIHIPFCLKKCRYCDFYSVKYDEPLKNEYIGALLKEIELSYLPRYIDTVYFGGGTPSILSAKDLGNVLEVLSKKTILNDGAEITIEANPGTITPEKIKELKKTGINRLSLGVQSMEDKELLILDRVHSSEDCLNAIKIVSERFHNYSVDIIYGIPEQTTESLKKTLEILTRLGTPHISAYELTIHEGTSLYNMLSKGLYVLPSEEEIISQYMLIVDTLRSEGYVHYEISNYAKAGFQCLHNQIYWRREEYLGLGVSAHSLIGEVRRANVDDIREYIQGIKTRGTAVKEIKEITQQERLMEEIMLSLRTSSGINIKNYPIKKETVKQLMQMGLVEVEGDRLTLTDSGMVVSNRVIIELLDSMSDE